MGSSFSEVLAGANRLRRRAVSGERWRARGTPSWPTGYVAIGVSFVLLLALVEMLIVGDAERSHDHAVQSLEAGARHAAEAKARELSQLLTDVYITTRTVSLLPAVRRPAPQNRITVDDNVVDGRRFTLSDEETVSQLYQHLADMLRISEIYIVYDGFAPERGEVPFLMFDSVIVDRIRQHAERAPATGGAQATEQLEDAEYAEIVAQLALFRERHPTLPVTAPRGIASLVSRPLITCDDSQYLGQQAASERDRQGLLYSVPVYDPATHRFKGLVTTVVRLNVLEARLLGWPIVPVTEDERAHAAASGFDKMAPANFILSHDSSGVRIFDRRNRELADIAPGKPRSGRELRLPLEGQGGNGWTLTHQVPSAAYDALGATMRRDIGVRSSLTLAVLGALSAVATLLVRQRRRTVRMQELADFDALTGLPNRRQIDRKIDASVRAAEAQGGGMALVMVDLDNFKTVNDVHGHHVGDLLLVEVARRFRKTLALPEQAVGSEAPAAVVGRLGGDEFLIMLPGYSDEAAVCAVAERLLAALAVPMVLDGRTLPLRASMGVAIFPAHGQTPAQLLRCADQAMYASKRIEDSAVTVHQRDADPAALRRVRLVNDLREGLHRDQFELHYQGIVDVGRFRIYGAEALLRWRHPEFGWVGPNEFVPLLESTGVIVPVGLWALRRACEQLMAWQEAGSSIQSVSVNVSIVQLAQSDFSEDALEVIATTGVDPGRITIEVTETVLMVNPERSIAQLQRLNTAGVRIAIDDFGTGYSSLAYLRRLPVHVMKIDRSLLVDAVDPVGRAILAALVSLAGELGLGCVAEGVETLEQFDLLRNLGCQSLQGYLFARPLPAHQAAGVALRMSQHRSASASSGSGSDFTPSTFGSLLPFDSLMRVEA